MKKPKAKPEEKINVKKIQVRRSPVILLLRLLTLDIIFIIAGLTQYIIISSLIPSHLIEIYLITIVSNIGLGFMLIAYSVWIILKWKNHYYEIYPASIIEKQGVFYNDEKSYSCNRIESIQLKQSILGNILGFGTIQLYDPFLEKYINLNNIAHPQKYFSLLKDIYVKTDNKRSSNATDKKVADFSRIK